MSAIAGIVTAPGRKAALADARAMLAALSYRAPDGGEVWSGGEAALAHGLFRTLAEDEPQPVLEAGVRVVADVRLDNRAELIDLLAPPDADLSDARLIALAWRRFGEALPEHLIGDFAFALWDPDAKTLFAARDFIGTKPFYYRLAEGRLAFATEIRALLAGGGPPGRIDEARIAEYLVGVWPPAGRTPYVDILRLEPGHSLTLRGGNLALRRYWAPPSGPAIPRKDAPEQFRDLFKRAVADRMRGLGPQGSMLSGGLDSSAVSCVAAPLHRAAFGSALPAYALVFDQTPQWSERPWVEAVLEGRDFEPVMIDGGGIAPLGRVDEVLKSQGSFFAAPTSEMTSRVYKVAADRGCKILLSGHGGDEVVSQGLGLLSELALAGRWLALWRELKGAADIYGGSPLAEFRHYAATLGPLGPVQNGWRRLKARFRPPAPEAGQPRWLSGVNPDFAERTGVRELRRAAMSKAAAAMDQHAYHRAITDAAPQSHAMEVLDRQAAAAGIEVRYPFWDQRLHEFCLSLEPREILDGGWPRLVFRRAMEGILPAKVQWRRDKLDFSPHLILGMLEKDRQMIDAVIQDDAADIGGYVDLAAARAAWAKLKTLRETANGYDAQFVWRTVLFGRWLAGHRAEIRQGAA